MTLLEPVMHYILTCGGKRLNLQQVAEATERDRRQVLRVLDKLAREGYLQEIADNPTPPLYGEVGPPRRNPTWKIVGDLKKRPKINPPRRMSMRSKIWKLIRAKRRFTKADLVAPSGANPATVDEYVRHLELGGYVRRTGKDGHLVTYMLVKINQINPPAGLFGGKS